MKQYRIHILLVVATILLVWGQDRWQLSAQVQPLIGSDLPVEDRESFGHMVNGGRWRMVDAEPVDEAVVRDALGPSAADGCDNASVLDVPDAGVTVINTFEEDATDPNLTCMWGSPPGNRGYKGYRTAWYQFTAPYTGQAVVEVSSNADYFDNYDTVVGIFSGICHGGLTLLACDDDSLGFLSRAETLVYEGGTYYIEIADRSLGVNGDAILNVTVFIDSTPVGSLWEQVDLLEEARSRHAVVAVDKDLYVIAGQTSVSGNPRRTGTLNRFDTETQTWTTLAKMPGPDGFGYSNTGAAYDSVGDMIYLPAGYVGDNDDYDGTHWAYDIEHNTWMTKTSLPWSNGKPLGYMGVVHSPNLQGYYVTGGLDGAFFDAGNAVRGDFWFYNYASGDWIGQASLGTPRYGHTAAWVNGKACVVGGIGDGGGFPVLLSAGECISPSAQTWTPIAGMNIPRYNAGSAVGPDGRWYVFGGTAFDGTAVPQIEVYNPLTDQWQILGVRYYLTDPKRSWPRGGFVDNELWVVGGETAPGGQVVSLVEKIVLPDLRFRLYAPSVFNQYPEPGPGINFLEARPMVINEGQRHSFSGARDRFHVFTFYLEQTMDVNVILKLVPQGSDYDLWVYDDNKAVIGTSIHPGASPEVVDLNGLEAGRYFVMLVRAYPPGDIPDGEEYALIVNDQ
ncbi:MAG TPA: hypothetical protein VLL52_23705 [Anaerolineae bacterium]|nr:hypothetical protein [Anaerolineae bacterium]